MTNLGTGHNGGPPLEELEVVRVRVLPDGRLGRKNAAIYLRRSPKTLAQWALHGKGPPLHDIGGYTFIAGRDSSPPATPGAGSASTRAGAWSGSTTAPEMKTRPLMHKRPGPMRNQHRGKTQCRSRR